MGLGSFLKKYAAVRGTVSPATPLTSVSTEMVSAKTVSPATLQAVNPVSPATLPDVISKVKNQVVLTNTVLPATLKRKVREIPREERLLRDEKCLFIKMCYDLHVNEGKKWPVAAEFVAVHFRERFPLLAAKNLLNYANLRSWRAQLCDNPGVNRPDPSAPPDFRYMDNLIRDYGGKRTPAGDQRFYIQLQAILLNSQKAKLAKEYKKLAELWIREYPEFKIPKIHQVRYHLKTLPPRLLALACKGENYYAQHYENYIVRDPESVQVNENWVADNLECDFYIRVEDGKGSFKAVRPWLCAIMDVKSEYIVGCILSEEGINNAVIRAAFASAILKFGRPMRFVTDNGADFCKRGFTIPVVFTPSVDNSVIYEHSILKELQIEHKVTAPYNAKAKPVERFFRELNEYSRSARGWVGNSIENRPASAELWSRAENCSLLMTKEEASTFLQDAISRYHSRPASGSKYLKGMSPEQAFQSPGRSVARPLASIQDLAMATLMPIAESRIVNPRGPSVTVGRIRYVACEGREKLWSFDNKPVMVKFDMQSIERCYVFDLSGKPLAICHAERPIPYFAEEKEEKAALSDALADIRNERKILNTMLLNKTGGFHKLDPESIAQLPPESFEKNAVLRLVDQRTAVKGETHNPRIYVTKSEFEEKSQTVLTENTVSPATLETKKVRESDPEMRRAIQAYLDSEEPARERAVEIPKEEEEEEKRHERVTIPDDY